MTVYEATKKIHYQKLAEFIAAQKQTNMTFRSWRVMYPDAEASMIEFAKQQRPQLDIWVCEDDKNEIRYALSIEKRGPAYNPKEVKLLTYATSVLDDRDYETGNFQYCEELYRHLFTVYPPLGYVKGEFIGTPEIIEATKTFFGDKLKVVKEVTPEPTKGFPHLFFYTIDFSEEPEKKTEGSK